MTLDFLALKPFADTAEIKEIVRAFAACETAPQDFHHREHLAVALFYCVSYPPAEATARMCLGLQKFLAHHGLTQGYDEALTLLWLRRVNDFIGQASPSDDLPALANALLVIMNYEL